VGSPLYQRRKGPPTVVMCWPCEIPDLARRRFERFLVDDARLPRLAVREDSGERASARCATNAPHLTQNVAKMLPA